MAADAYADSSFLVSVYRADPNHQAANEFLAGHAFTLAFNPLHRIEVRNALRKAVAVGEYSRADCIFAFRQIENDLVEGFLIPMQINWTDTFRRADELSEQHASQAGQRTIDLLHVAAALESDVKIFLSFDIRQRKLAAAAGLTVKP